MGTVGDKASNPSGETSPVPGGTSLQRSPSRESRPSSKKLQIGSHKANKAFTTTDSFQKQTAQENKSIPVANIVRTSIAPSGQSSPPVPSNWKAAKKNLLQSSKKIIAARREIKKNHEIKETRETNVLLTKLIKNLTKKQKKESSKKILHLLKIEVSPEAWKNNALVNDLLKTLENVNLPAYQRIDTHKRCLENLSENGMQESIQLTNKIQKTINQKIFPGSNSDDILAYLPRGLKKTSIAEQYVYAKQRIDGLKGGGDAETLRIWKQALTEASKEETFKKMLQELKRKDPTMHELLIS